MTTQSRPPTGYVYSDSDIPRGLCLAHAEAFYGRGFSGNERVRPVWNQPVRCEVCAVKR